MKEEKFKRVELVKLLAQLKLVPKKVYFARNGKSLKLAHKLKDVADFLGVTYERAKFYIMTSKHNIGDGKILYKIDAKKAISDLSRYLENH